MVGKPWQTSWLDSGSIFAGRQGMCSLLSVTRLRPRLPCLTTAKPSPYGQQGRAPTNPDWPDPALSPRVGGDMRHLLPPAGHRDRRGYIFFCTKLSQPRRVASLIATMTFFGRKELDPPTEEKFHHFWPPAARRPGQLAMRSVCGSKAQSKSENFFFCRQRSKRNDIIHPQIILPVCIFRTQ